MNTPLSPRERQVAALIAEGRTNAEIASRLRIGANTVKNHTRSIYAKLGIQDKPGNPRVLLARWYWREQEKTA
ncbi:MAG TPA: LuxR family transcriptional regulator [Chloroflexi bacterium]|nr:LuxR family transcriptional regulator [Chloroflexota bacterium]